MVEERLCGLSEEQSNPSNSEGIVKILFLTNKVLSFELKYEHYCLGDSHPNDGVQYYVIDLTSGGIVDLYTQLRNSGEFEKFIAKKFYAKASKPCKQFYEAPEDLSLAFIIKPNGITLKPEFAYAIKSCVFEITTTCEVVMPFLNRDSWLASYCIEK